MRKWAASSARGPGGGFTFGHGRQGFGGMGLGGASIGGAIAKGSEPGNGAEELEVLGGLGLRADERKDGTRDDGDVGAVDEFEHAQGVADLFGLPCVAGDHGDAEDLRFGRLQENHHSHLVRAAGAGAVLVDEDEALLG